jgi:hypothetical protein
VGPGQLEVENPLVHSSELLNTKIRIGDSLPSVLARSRRQDQEDLAHGPLIERHRRCHRRLGRGKEAAVERCDPKRSGAASAMRQPRDGLQRFPHALWPCVPFNRNPEGLDRVTGAVYGVPAGDEPPRLREQEEQEAVQHYERLVEQRGRGRTSTLALRSREGAQQMFERVVDPALK